MQNCRNSSYDSFALTHIMYLLYDKVTNVICPKKYKGCKGIFGNVKTTGKDSINVKKWF